MQTSVFLNFGLIGSKFIGRKFSSSVINQEDQNLEIKMVRPETKIKRTMMI